jgi:hypothetical protein
LEPYLTCDYQSIIAEGVPESQTRAMNKVAMTKGVGIIGPATVGGIKVSYMYVEFAIDFDFTKSQSLLLSLDAFESEILAACWTIL